MRNEPSAREHLLQDLGMTGRKACPCGLQSGCCPSGAAARRTGHAIKAWQRCQVLSPRHSLVRWALVGTEAEDPRGARESHPGVPGWLRAHDAGEDCASSRRVLRGGGHCDIPREDVRNPRCSGPPYLALSSGGTFAHDSGVRLTLLEGVHAAPAPPPGRAEGGVSVLWECVVWHHPSLSTPPRTRPCVSRKPLPVPRL